MSDIVEKLRTYAAGWRDDMQPAIGEPLDEAADEIERLRGECDAARREAEMWRNENTKKQTACEQMGARISSLEADLAAARREGIEAAAKVCDERAHAYRAGTPTDSTMGAIEEATALAAAIRALLTEDRR